MPRTLSRLRFRPNVAKPLHFVGPSGTPRFSEEILQKKATAYVVRQSNPRNLRLALVVDHRSRRQPTGKHVTPPRKPFTLRDVVDPEAKAQHGEIIYVFRHIRTNQIIYSLQELMSDHHLEQLPFLGKHSKPATIRPDEWTPHCVISFATPEQGHNAFRRLREFRKLHEYAWEKQYPEWKQMTHKNRMKKIMDQRANMVADLAEVLRLQEVQAKLMARTFASRESLVKKHIRRRWSAIQNQAKATGKDMNNPKWVEHRIHMVERKMKMKHKQNPKDQEELQKAKAHYEDRLAKLQRDNKRIEALQSFEEELAKKREPALEAGARERLAEMQKEADSLIEAIANPDPLRSESELAEDSERAGSLMEEIKELEEAFEADAQLGSKDHPVMRSVLPANRKLDLKKSFRAPFNLQDVRIRWADIQDALYARGQWPEIIEHETLDVYAAREKTTLLSYEDYQVELQNEVASVMDLLRVKGAISEPEPEPEPEYVSQEQQSSILPLLPNGGKVFKDASA